jgi:uncharacterized protein
MPRHAISWFEIPTRDMDRAQRFYETVLGQTLRREAMGPATLAVFPYEPDAGVGGCLMAGPTALLPQGEGTLVYLDAGPALDAVLDRVWSAGGRVATPRTALPPGMGFFAHIVDPDGNRIGLHALA